MQIHLYAVVCLIGSFLFGSCAQFTETEITGTKMLHLWQTMPCHISIGAAMNADIPTQQALTIMTARCLGREI